MKLSSEVLERARQFIYQNARLLDRKRFEYFFENGTQEAVLSVLRGYQNEDGGFGNALEPDIRCPNSQPVTTQVALTIMEGLQAFDPTIMEGIVRYLKQITITDTGGFPQALRSLNDYPHAPWWTTEQDGAASMNPTGIILGLLYKQKAISNFYQEDWFKQSEQFVWEHLDQINASDYHDVIQGITFLENAPDRVQSKDYLSQINVWLSGPELIERNPKAEGYVHKVLDWAPSMDSYSAKFISEVDFELHLHDLVLGQHEDGGWTISWPTVSPMCELEWRGYITVERLNTLRSFGWL